MEEKNLPSEKEEKTVKKSSLTAKKSLKTVKSNKSVKSANLHATRRVSVVNVKSEEKAPFPWSVVIVAVVMTALFLFMMMNYAEVDKYRSEIANLDNKIASLEKQESDLNAKLGSKYDLKEIADYAENELGMVKSNTLRKHVITMKQDDRTEMHTYDDGEEGGLGFLLTGLGEVFRDFLEE